MHTLNTLLKLPTTSVMVVSGPVIPAQLVIVPPLTPPVATALTSCVLVLPSLIEEPSIDSIPVPLKLVKLVSAAVPVNAGLTLLWASLSLDGLVALREPRNKWLSRRGAL